MKFHYPEGSTPLDLDEIDGLIPTHITNQHDLNAWEEKNISFAERWGFKQKNITSLDAIIKLHERMFNKTWKWAGKFRKSEKNIGVSWNRVPTDMKNLCDDVRFQIDNNIYSKDEIAIRFHHRLTQIHAFPNGNGRHARLAANILIILLGQPRFTWGMNQTLSKESEVRRQYINALRSADNGNYKDLLEFARS